MKEFSDIAVSEKNSNRRVQTQGRDVCSFPPKEKFVPMRSAEYYYGRKFLRGATLHIVYLKTGKHFLEYYLGACDTFWNLKAFQSVSRI